MRPVSVYPFTADCGHEIAGQSAIGAGYALFDDPDGVRRSACYSCTAERYCAMIRDPKELTIVLFVTPKGGIATWDGAVLGVVRSWKVIRAGFCGQMTHYRVEMFDGSRWHGRGLGEGCSLTLHRVKGDPHRA
jgi:hypothetical protein